MTLVLPHTFVNGTDADGTQVNENFAAIVAAVEGVGAASSGADVYQAGVLASTDWKLPSQEPSFNTATGAISYAAAGGAAWLPGPSGGLVRTFVAPGAAGPLKPPVLPGPSGYVCAGLELTASGAGALLSVVSGAEQVSEAAALAASPAVSAGKVRLYDAVVLNTAGVYSNPSYRDRRPWARGARAVVKRTSGAITLGAVGALDATGLALRVECSGAPLVLQLLGRLSSSSSAQAALGFRMDGSAVDGTKDAGLAVYGLGSTLLEMPVAVSYVHVPAAGSHLFQPSGVLVSGSNASVRSDAEVPLEFVVYEDLRRSANNGTV